jgi:hypothetical protein
MKRKRVLSLGINLRILLIMKLLGGIKVDRNFSSVLSGLKACTLDTIPLLVR